MVTMLTAWQGRLSTPLHHRVSDNSTWSKDSGTSKGGFKCQSKEHFLTANQPTDQVENCKTDSSHSSYLHQRRPVRACPSHTDSSTAQISTAGEISACGGPFSRASPTLLRNFGQPLDLLHCTSVCVLVPVGGEVSMTLPQTT